MGSVFEAEHTGTGRRVAVKVINSGDLSRNEMLISRFQREAKAAGAIDTQHITQVLDTGTDRDTSLPYMVMEYLSGEDLQQTLKRLGPIMPDLALRIVAQTCLGLQKAHEAGVVHRDIKPANLFLARRDAGEVIVKLLDFGIAKVKMDHANETESAGLTRTGNMLGSPLYMSPEQARGTRQIDHRADIWSLGVVLYQALTGRTPYAHIQALGELIIAICHDPPQPVQDFAPWVAPEIAAIVHGALKLNPADRYESAAAMFHAIRPLLPYGWAISEDMLITLPEPMKLQVAPRLEVTFPGANAKTGHMSVPPGAMPDATASPMVQSQTGAQKGSSKVPIAIGAVMLAAIGGVGIYFATKRPVEVPVEPAAAVQVAPAPTPAPVASSAVTQAATSTAPPVMKRVMLVVLPSDASVEVEGKPVANNKSIVEIEGTPGSVHKVRVFKGKNESFTNVVVTENGAIPPKVELLTGSLKPAASGAATTAPAVTTAPTTPPAQPGIIDKFE
jgi:eukaryotic-like serine/threonine-protein kinase